MVRLILGVKGSGKTKQLIEMINNAAKDEPGSVVCIEADSAMMFDIHYQIRLIDAKEYQRPLRRELRHLPRLRG